MLGHAIQAAEQRELASKNGNAGHTGTPGAVHAAPVNTRSHWGDTQGDIRLIYGTVKKTTEGPHAHTDTAASLQLTNRQAHTHRAATALCSCEGMNARPTAAVLPLKDTAAVETLR